MPNSIRGWPFRNPPNVRFGPNKRSSQWDGLDTWLIALDAKGLTWRDKIAGRNQAMVGATLQPVPKIGKEYYGSAIKGSGVAPPFGRSGTIACWCRLAAHAGYYYLFDTSSDRTLLLYNWDETWTLYINGNLISETVPDIMGVETAHIVLTWRNGEQIVYKNGQVHASYSVSIASGSTPTTLYLGQRFTDANYWNGGFTEFRVYDHCKSPGEASDIYNPETRWELIAPEIPMFYSIPVVAAADVSNPPRIQPMRIWKGVR